MAYRKKYTMITAVIMGLVTMTACQYKELDDYQYDNGLTIHIDNSRVGSSPEEYRAQLEDLWYDAPDVLTPADVQKLTGYSQSYVSSWMVSGKLRTVTVHSSPITSRDWLIDFMCATGHLLPKKGK